MELFYVAFLFLFHLASSCFSSFFSFLSPFCLFKQRWVRPPVYHPSFKRGFPPDSLSRRQSLLADSLDFLELTRTASQKKKKRKKSKGDFPNFPRAKLFSQRHIETGHARAVARLSTRNRSAFLGRLLRLNFAVFATLP